MGASKGYRYFPRVLGPLKELPGFCLGASEQVLVLLRSLPGHRQRQPAQGPRPSAPLLRALWSLLAGIWGVLKCSWGVLAVLAVSRDLKGSLKGDIDIEVEVDVDTDRHFGCEGISKVNLGTLLVLMFKNSEMASPGSSMLWAPSLAG